MREIESCLLLQIQFVKTHPKNNEPSKQDGILKNTVKHFERHKVQPYAGSASNS